MFVPCFKSIVAGTVLAMSVMTAPAFSAQNTLTLALGIEPDGLDPTVAAPAAIGQVTWQNIFEGLIGLDENGKIVPLLAKSWDISDDGLTYTFHLQEGVKFHDGTPFDSASAKFTLDRARGETSINPQKQFFAAISSIETPDPHTLVLRLSAPTSTLLYWLSWPASVMVSPQSADQGKIKPVGTGPFKFVSWAKGSKVELEKNADYWNRENSAQLEKVTFRFITDASAQTAALKAGDIDGIPEFGAPELMTVFETDPRFQTEVGTTALKVVAGMNNSRAPFDDKRVRQALMMAIDRKTLIDAVWSGYGTPIGSHYTPNDPGYIDLTGVFSYDPQKAKALLAEAGYPNGFSFTIKTPQMAYAPRSAEVMQSMFADIGVKMTIEPTEFPAKWIQDVFLGRDFDMTIVAHAEPLNIDIYGRDPYYFNYKNPEFNQLMSRIQATTDTAERNRLYGEAQKQLAQDVPALYLFAMPKLSIWNKKLQGYWKNDPVSAVVLNKIHWQD